MDKRCAGSLFAIFSNRSLNSGVVLAWLKIFEKAEVSALQSLVKYGSFGWACRKGGQRLTMTKRVVAILNMSDLSPNLKFAISGALYSSEPTGPVEVKSALSFVSGTVWAAEPKSPMMRFSRESIRRFSGLMSR